MSGESDLAGAPVSAPAPLWSRRSLRWFLLISFGIPWLGWTIVAVTGVGDSALGTALFYTGDFMTVGGFVATYVAAGRPGVLGLFKRYIQVSAPLPWALAASMSAALLVVMSWRTAPTLVQRLRQHS